MILSSSSSSSYSCFDTSDLSSPSDSDPDPGLYFWRRLASEVPTFVCFLRTLLIAISIFLHLAPLELTLNNLKFDASNLISSLHFNDIFSQKDAKIHLQVENVEQIDHLDFRCVNFEYSIMEEYIQDDFEGSLDVVVRKLMVELGRLEVV